MNMKYLLLIATAAATLLALLGCKSVKNSVNNKPVPTGKLVSFHYAEYGTMPQPNFEYTLKSDTKGKVKLCVFKLWDEKWGDTIKVDAGVLEHVEKLIKDNNLQNYLDHYRPEFEVLDGYGWGYEAEFDDESILHSGGSNARPGDNTLEVIAEYLDSCYASVKGIKLKN